MLKNPEKAKALKDDMSIVNMTPISSRDTIGVKFLSAGIAACIADFITFPLDTAKVRLQIQGENFQAPSLVNNVSHINHKPLNTIYTRSIHTIALNAPYHNQLYNKSVLKAFAYTQKHSSASSSNYQPKGLASRNVQSLVLDNLGKSMISDKLAKTQFTPNQSAQIYKGLLGTICTITKQEGPKALYNGLVAGLHRQMSFASIRIGLYDSVRGQYENLFNSFTRVHVFKDNVGLRIMAGITTGGLAVCLAQPADVVKVRLQAQIKSQTTAGPRYKGAMDAYKTICKREGLKGLWRGIMPNMARNSVINACELVGYDIFKQYILRKKLLSDNVGCHFFAAFGAGFITTIIASPIDVVKTRFMNAPQGHYKGSLHCAYLMITKEGPKSFYKGFTPSFVRLASWNVIMFVCYEQLKRQFVKLKQ